MSVLNEWVAIRLLMFSQDVALIGVTSCHFLGKSREKGPPGREKQYKPVGRRENFQIQLGPRL